MKRVLSLIWVLSVAWSVPASAEPKADFSVSGWNDGKVLVERSERGQREVEGVFKDYSIEMLDVYDAKTRKIVESYKRGKGTGAVGKAFEKAKAEDKAPTPKVKAVSQRTSPDGRYFVDRVTQRATIQTKSKKNVCTIEERLQLFDTKDAKVFVIASGKVEGSASTKRKPPCPDVDVEFFWSEDNKQIAMTRSIKGRLDLRTASMDTLETFPHAPFIVFQTQLTSTGRFKENATWKTMFHGDFKSLEKQLEKPTERLDQLASTMLLAIDKDTRKKSRREVDKIFKKIKSKTPWDYAMRAAVYRASGDAKRARRDLDRAIKNAKGYAELVEIADLFYYVDLDIAAQLYLHAVSHPEAQAEGFDSAYGYAMLLRVLLDAGNMLNAQELIEKFDEYKGDFAIQVARYETLRRDPEASAVVADSIFENPGVCDAYLYAGRALGAKNSKQAMIHFQSAIACDPHLAEAIFLLADLEWRRGNKPRAKELYARYRMVAFPRQGDEVRSARRQHAYNLTIGQK